MKKLLLLFLIVFCVKLSYSQVIVKLTSVPCNNGLEGLYPFEYAGESGGYTNWNCPNMLIPSNAVSGLLEVIDDGTSGIVFGVGTPPLNNIPKSALGCDTLGNISQDLSGKIAVIYRGSCEFGYKAYNAQKRGAIGVIIINHTGDPITMGGGVYGHLVNIPVVMIGRIAGDDLYSAIQLCNPDSITGFIGSKLGMFNNDMASSKGDILMTHELSIPQILVISSTLDYSMDLGIWMYNLGVNAQTGVTANVSVTKNGNVVYAQTSVPLNFSAPNFSDSSNIIIDTQYVDLGVFIPNSGYWYKGDYLVEYTINNAGDEDLSDNSFSYVFKVTNNIYSKSRTDANNEPLYNTAYALDETVTQYDDWEACIVLNKQSGNYYNNSVSHMTVSASPVRTLMEGEILEARIYEWNDVFVDIDTPPTFNSLLQIGYGFHFYGSADPDSLGNKVIDIFDNDGYQSPIIIENNKRYLFCVFTESDSLRISYDKEPNYKATINHYKQPIAPLKTFPNGGAAIWDWKGFGFDRIPAVSVYFDYHTSVNDDNVSSESIPYPNPTTNLLTVPVRKGVLGNVKVEVFDLTGKLVLSENQHIGNEPLKVNVASIKNGTYLFQLTFVDGTTNVFKISVNR